MQIALELTFGIAVLWVVIGAAFRGLSAWSRMLEAQREASIDNE